MEPKKENPIAVIWKLAKSKHTILIISMIFSIIGVVCGFLPFVFISKIVKMLINNTATMNTCKPYLIMSLVLLIACSFFTLLSTALSHKGTFSVLAEIRSNCLKKLSKLSMGTLQEQSVGKWKTILVDQIESMEKTLAHLIPEMTGNIGTTIVIFIALLIVDWRLALLCLVTLPIAFAFMFSTMKAYGENYGKSVEINRNMNNNIVEYINGVKVIKAFNQSDKSYAKYADSIKANAQFYYNWMKKSLIGTCGGTVIVPSVLLTVIPFGLLFYNTRILTGIDFITTIILSMSLMPPIIKCMDYVDNLAIVGTIVDSVQMILSAPEQNHPDENVKIKGTDISLQNVCFSYSEKNGQVLNGINLNIKSGTKTALVGPSGGGKSTIAKLIAGFWDASSGCIKLGDKNLTDIPLTQISDSIAYVSQDNFLFNDTVRNNIRVGMESASDKDVEEIAKRAGCYDFIMNLDKGFDTVVGGGGAHLSGGERQRISIARAMLKNAPIIILDEATAYIDPENEAILQESIGKLVKNKTLIVIAHRLKTITNSDQIAFVQDGQIINAGTHNDMLLGCKEYHNMWNANNDCKEAE